MKKLLFIFWLMSLAILKVNAQTEYIDVVYLKNGSVIRGQVLEQISNQTLKLQTADESIFVFKMEDVLKIVKEKKIIKEPIENNQAPIQQNQIQERTVNPSQYKESVLENNNDNSELLLTSTIKGRVYFEHKTSPISKNLIVRINGINPGPHDLSFKGVNKSESKTLDFKGNEVMLMKIRSDTTRIIQIKNERPLPVNKLSIATEYIDMQRRGFYNVTEIGLSVGVTTDQPTTYPHISTICGYQFNPYVSIGQGFSYNWTTYMIQDDENIYFQSSSFRTFIDLRLYFLKKRLVPLMYFDVGYKFLMNPTKTVSWPDEDKRFELQNQIWTTSEQPLFICSGLGIKYNISKYLSWIISLSGTMEFVNYDYSFQWADGNSLGMDPTVVHTDNGHGVNPITLTIRTGFVF